MAKLMALVCLVLAACPGGGSGSGKCNFDGACRIRWSNGQPGHSDEFCRARACEDNCAAQASGLSTTDFDYFREESCVALGYDEKCADGYWHESCGATRRNECAGYDESCGSQSDCCGYASGGA